MLDELATLGSHTWQTHKPFAAWERNTSAWLSMSAREGTGRLTTNRCSRLVKRSAASATSGEPFLQGSAGIRRGMADRMASSRLQTQMQDCLHSELYT